MTPLPTALLLTLSVLPTSSMPLASSPPIPCLGQPAPLDKNDVLIAKFGNPTQRQEALAQIESMGKKTPGKVRTYLMKQVGASDRALADDAMKAVIAVGKPMTKAVRTALDTGEFKGIPIAEQRAARIALRLDPSGKRFVKPHLESHALTPTLAMELRLHADPLAAFDILVGEAQKDASRSAALGGLRGLKRRAEFADAATVGEMLKKRTEGLDEGSLQILSDALIGIEEDDRERMEAWLGSGDPIRAESAMWSVGQMGRPFLDMASLLPDHLSSSDPAVRRAAFWALRHFAAGTDALAPDAEEETVDEAVDKAGPSKKKLEQQKLYRVLREFDDGVLRRPAPSDPAEKSKSAKDRGLGENALPYWQFAPRWITELGDDFTDPTFASESPAWDRDYLPGSIEDLVPTLQGALKSDDQGLATEAGLSLIEWNVISKELLEWSVATLASESNFGVLRPIWSLLVRESGHPWLDDADAVAGFQAALKNEATRAQTVKLLGRMKTDATRELLVAHFAGSATRAKWHTQHYLAIYSLMVTNRSDRPRLERILSRRFLAGDYRVAPMLVLGGEQSHDALTKALLSSVRDRQMVAIAILVEQGPAARTMCPKIRKVKALDPYTREFRDDSYEAIATGQ